MSQRQHRIVRRPHWALVPLAAFALASLVPATSRPEGAAGKAEQGAAEASEADKPEKTDKAEKAPVKAGEGAGAGAAPAGAGATTPPSTTLSATPPNKEGCPLCPVSNKDEIAVLMRLRERHTLLAARENVVAQKEAALGKLEESLDAQLTQYDVAMTKMEARLGVGEAKKAKRDAQLKTLVETLAGLSAKKAAPMLAEASPDFVAEIFRQLGATRVASLLAVMPANKAGKLIDLAVDAAPKPPAKKKLQPRPLPQPSPAEGEPANPGEQP